MTKEEKARQKEIDAIIRFNQKRGAVPLPVSVHKSRAEQAAAREKYWEAVAKYHDGGKRTLQEVGKKFGVTRERIRQILKAMGVNIRWYEAHPTPPKPPKLTPETARQRKIARFWSRVNITTDPDGCWDWMLPTLHKQGYPWVGMTNILPWRLSAGNRGQVVAWYLTYGTQPKHWVVNTCQNPICLNPRHLADIPAGDAIRKYRGPMSPRKKKTHCKHGHEYTPENTILLRNHRSCRACLNERHKRYYWAKKARAVRPDLAKELNKLNEVMKKMRD